MCKKLSKPHLFYSKTLINVNGQSTACLVNSVADILHPRAVNKTFFFSKHSSIVYAGCIAAYKSNASTFIKTHSYHMA